MNFLADIQAELNTLIEEVIGKYESRHRVKVLEHDMDSQDMIDNIGRHCASSVFRVNLTHESDGEKGRSSIILKVPHLSSCYEHFKKLGMYKMETYMYRTVLPRFCQIWHGESLAPTSYFASDSGVLALENLLERGFQVPPKSSQLDLDECEVVLKRLAQFHAISIKYFQLHGTEGFDSMMNFSSDTGFALQGLIGKVRTYVCPTLSASQLEKWADFETNCGTFLMDVYTSHNIGGFNVLIHGDVHSRNLLLKGDECKFIDFQLCRRGSPVLDLIYFLVTGVKWEVFELYRKRIFICYVCTLNETLKELGSVQRYSLEEMNADFEKYKAYCLFVLAVLIPMLWSESENIEMMNETETNKMDDVMKSEEFIALFKNWVDICCLTE